MSKVIFMIFAIIGGIAGGLQAPVNSALGKKIGAFEASFVSFFIGTLFLFFIFLFVGKGNILHVFSVPKWQYLGGILGSILVMAIIVGVPKLGVAATIFAVIIGQIAISLIIDHFGFFGVQKITFNWERLLGILFMICGVFLIFKSSFLR